MYGPWAECLPAFALGPLSVLSDLTFLPSRCVDGKSPLALSRVAIAGHRKVGAGEAERLRARQAATTQRRPRRVPGEGSAERLQAFPLQRAIVHNQREGVAGKGREMALLAKDATPNHWLRAARGRMTQEELAEALRNLAATKGQHPGINAKMVSNWERGIQTPSRESRVLLIEYFGRSAEALGLDQPTLDQSAQGCPLAPLVAYAGFAEETPATGDKGLFGAGAPAGAGTREGAATKRRTILKVIGGGLSSLVLGVRPEATADSVELTRQVAGSGAATLEQLNLVVEGLGLTYLSTPPAAVFDEAHYYRRRVTQLLEEHPTLARQRDLYVTAGWLSAILGDAAFDLGDQISARIHLNAAWQLASETGHHGLGGWVRGTQSMIALYTGRPREALELARAGQAFATSSAIANVRLPAHEARAAARLGDRRGTDDALDRAYRAFGGVTDEAKARSIFGFEETYLPFYAGTCYAWLNEPARTQEYAPLVITTYDAATGADRSPGDQALARIDLATSFLQQREVEEACRVGSTALDIYSDFPIESVARRSRELGSALDRWTVAVPAAQDFKDRLAAIGHSRQ
jgi:transcriptional regulator with XRE-family HTH domain